MPANALSTLRGSSGLLAARRPAIGPSLAAPPLGHRHLSVPLPPRRARPVTTAALGQKTPLRQEAEISTETLPGLMAIAAAAVHALANRFAGSAPALQHAQLSPGLIYSALSWYTLIAGVLHTVAQARQEVRPDASWPMPQCRSIWQRIPAAVWRMALLIALLCSRLLHGQCSSEVLMRGVG